MRLGEWPLPYVVIKCEKCGREGKLATARLEDQFGVDADMFMVREELAEPSCKREKASDMCHAKLADALLVDAILEPDVSKVVKPALLPEAREWRQKLGIEIEEFDSSREGSNA